VTCQECGDQFPDDLVRDFHRNGGRVKACGVCALALARVEHNDPGYVFGPATKARDIYDRCRRMKAVRAMRSR
jgi:NAD-dependent SIR2 family protein deacetylase